MTNQRQSIVAVCAPGAPSAEEASAAEVVGRALAERGAILVCGGLGGAMAAACRGAKAAGGMTIGILPGTDPTAANPWIDVPICTGLGQARNVIVVASGQATIAIGGGIGTLSEIAFGLRLGRPVILLGGWAPILDTEQARRIIEAQEGSLRIVISPTEAVDLAFSEIQESQRPASSTT